MAMNLSLNPAAVFLEAQLRAYDYNEMRTKAHLENLLKIDDQNELLQKLLTQLTHLRESKGEADGNKDKELQELMLQVHGHFPDIFSRILEAHTNKKTGAIDYKLNKIDLDCVLQAIDGRVKMQLSSYNQEMMYIEQGYKELGHYTDGAHDTLKIMDEHAKSILNKPR